MSENIMREKIPYRLIRLAHDGEANLFKTVEIVGTDY